MEDESKTIDSKEIDTVEVGLMNRRDFLDGLGKWSKIVIGATIFGGAVLSADHEAEAWVNRAGGWVNRGGGGAGWVNRGGGGGAGWVNRSGGSAAWANRGAGWANRGGSWINRY